jgi:hypothetical protein
LISAETLTELNSSLTNAPPMAASILGSASSYELVFVQLFVLRTCLLTHTANVENTPTTEAPRHRGT